MNKTIVYGGILIAIVIASVSLFVTVQTQRRALALGVVGTRFPNGISADSTSPVAGQVRGTTLAMTGASTFGGKVTVTTSNTATSSLIAGCFQFYATSTATAQKFLASTTPGVMVSQYGTCP